MLGESISHAKLGHEPRENIFAYLDLNNESVSIYIYKVISFT